MAIRPEEITGVILKQLDDYEGKTEVGEEGFADFDEVNVLLFAGLGLFAQAVEALVHRFQIFENQL
ncbi:MAG: hypothetical protein AAB576_02225, partial [Elusimicrobiota bacterium]